MTGLKRILGIAMNEIESREERSKLIKNVSLFVVERFLPINSNEKYYFIL